MSKRYHTFKKKLTLAFILVGVCPLLIFGIYNIIYVYKSTEKEIREFTVSNMETSIRNINKSMIGFRNMVDVVSTNKEIIKILNKDNKVKKSERFEDTQKLYSVTSSLISTMPLKMPIHIVDKNGISRYSSTKYYKPIYEDTKEDFYKILNKEPDSVHQKIYRRYDQTLGGDVVFILGKAVLDKNKNVVGYVIIEILDKYFDQYINNISFFKETNVYITEFNGNIITDKLNKGDTGKNINKVLNSIEKENLYYSSDISGRFEIISTIPKTSLYGELYKNIKVFIIVFLVTVTLAVIVIYFLSKRISEPIHEMSMAMKKVENGNRDVKVEYIGDDELGELCNKFNNMILEINRLIEEDYNKRLLIRQAEFKALKSQVNPHFLYNSLATINWMVKLGEKEKVIKMIDALSKLFRYSCKNNNDTVLIRDEINGIKNYLIIQECRYDGKLKVTLDIHKDIENKKIIKLILQPIVENAIIHGLSNKIGDWVLVIKGYIKGSEIIFEVKDNGVGVGNSNHSGEGIGVLNVDERIKIQYGKNYGICNYEEDGFTIFKINIPIEEAKDEESSSSR